MKFQRKNLFLCFDFDLFHKLEMMSHLKTLLLTNDRRNFERLSTDQTTVLDLSLCLDESLFFNRPNSCLNLASYLRLKVFDTGF